MTQFKTKHKRSRNIPALAMALLLSCSAAAFAGCNEVKKNDSTTTRTDTCKIANGNFENYSDDNALKLVVSPTGWTKSVGQDKLGNSASASTRDSGIVNTEANHWKSMTTYSALVRNTLKGEAGGMKYFKVASKDAEELRLSVTRPDNDSKINSSNLPYIAEAMKEAQAMWKNEDTTIRDHLIIYKALQDAIGSYNTAVDETKFTINDFEYYSDYNYSINIDSLPALLDCAENEGLDKTIRIANPETHKGKYEYDSAKEVYNLNGSGAFTATDTDEGGEYKLQSGVLMLHNYRSGGLGTAQKFTSGTTVTLEAGTSAELSMWVKTEGMTYNEGVNVQNNRGAYIGVTHTVGNNTLEQMQIKNINTEGVTENNGWVKYTVYLKACPYTSSTFTVVLGLGQGSNNNTYEFVDGFAFFDDVTLKTFSNKKFDEVTKDVSAGCTLFSDGQDKVFCADSEKYKNVTKFYIDLYGDSAFHDIDFTGKSNDAKKIDASISYDLTTAEKSGKTYVTSSQYADGSSTADKGYSLMQDIDISTKNDIVGTTTYAELESKVNNGNKYLDAAWNNSEFDYAPLKEFPSADIDSSFNKNEDMIFMLSGNGASYTAAMTSDAFTLEPEQYMLVSYWVKTSNVSGYIGATATLRDKFVNSEDTGFTTSAIGPYNTANIPPVDLDKTDEDEAQEDIYSGWVQCFFFISNETENTHYFDLQFSYGPTAILDTTANSYCPGYAAFTGFRYMTMSKDQFGYIGNAAHSATVALHGNDTSNGSNGFSAATPTDAEKIENNIVNAQNYNGTYGGSAYVTTNGKTDGDYNKLNANANAGVVNKQYVGNYVDNAKNNPDDYKWFTNVLNANNVNVSTLDAMNALDAWNKVFGTATQPLLISNVVAGSYGYFSTAYNLSSSGYSAVSIRVMAKGTDAYIYLVNTDKLFDGYDKLQTVETINVTYWYDDEGNICTADPKGDNFNPKTMTAFYLSDNGWFNVNEKSVYFSSLSADEQAKLKGMNFANLHNYEKDAEGNLVVAKNSTGSPVVSYDYADNYYDDGIAYYLKGDKYYAYSSSQLDSLKLKDVEINNLPDSFTANYARYINTNYAENISGKIGDNVTVTGKTNVQTMIKVADTNGEWVTVNFFIHTGSKSFPYRLEVFSGTRDGSVEAPAGSYVAFDVCNTSDISSNYAPIMNELMDKYGYMTDVKTGRVVNKADKSAVAGTEYYCYTFFDDPGFQRYDVALDTNEVGNPYTGYVQSDNTEGLTYIYFEDDYTMFLDYGTISQNVNADDSYLKEEEEEEHWWESPEFWLMLVSIAFAAILVIVLIIVLIRFIIKKANIKTQKHDNRYNAQRMRYIKRLNLQTEEDEAEAAAPAAAESTSSAEDDNDPYND